MFTVRFPVQAPIESQQLYHLSYGGIVYYRYSVVGCGAP